MLDRARDLLTTKKPWLDLIYLGFFFLEWFVDPPGTTELALALGALALFLAVYIWVMRRRDWTVLAGCAVSLALGFALARYNIGAGVFIIFTAPMIARLPDPALRTPSLIVIGPVIFLTGLLLSMPWYFILATLVLGTISALSAGTSARRAEEAEAEAERVEMASALAAQGERDRMARDLHDLLGHTLSVIALKADIAERLLDQDAERVRPELKAIHSISRDALAEVREVVSGLKRRSLPAAWAELEARLADAGMEVETRGLELDLDADLSAGLVMILREAVTNILRHSGASAVRVALERSASGLALSIEDNGRGGLVESGSGLSGMRDRVASLGGDIRFDDAGRGARIGIRIPLAGDAA